MRVFKAVPSKQDLQNMFTYDDELGVLRWKISKQKINIGDPAGGLDKNGYTVIGIDGIQYKAHRLIFQFHKGNLLPTDLIDHENKTEKNELKDNRIKNLRKNTQSGNGCNTGVSKNSKTGIKGVCWDSGVKKYRANIGVSGKVENLGRFTNKFEAYETYRQRCLEVDPISYADNSKDMRPEVFQEYQNYLLQKSIIEAASPNRYAAINDQKFNIFELAI